MKMTKRTASAAWRAVIPACFMALFGMSPAVSLAVDLAKGKALYQVHCAGCHGEDGHSINPEAPSFARGERLFQPDSALIDAVRSGTTTMPPFMGILTDLEILDVVSYAKTLQW